MGNALLARAYEQTFDLIRLIRIEQPLMMSPAAIARTMSEHLEIIAACKARAPDLAESALGLHFARAMQRAIGL
jgi:DNA-binding GntR family transcriptional regulator